MATPNPARAGPSMSIGSAYRFVLIERAQNELTQMAAAASTAFGISGMAAVAISEAMAQIQHTRIRAFSTLTPPRIQ